MCLLLFSFYCFLVLKQGNAFFIPSPNTPPKKQQAKQTNKQNNPTKYPRRKTTKKQHPQTQKRNSEKKTLKQKTNKQKNTKQKQTNKNPNDNNLYDWFMIGLCSIHVFLKTICELGLVLRFEPSTHQTTG